MATFGPPLVVTSGIVDDAITAAKIAAQAVGTSEIEELSIVNADVSATAAIVDTKLDTITTAGKVSGAAITLLTSLPAGAGVIPAANLPASGWKVGSATRASDATSGDQTIAHGLGKTPSFVRITVIGAYFGLSTSIEASFGSFDGTNHACVSFSFDGAGNTPASVTNATNIVYMGGNGGAEKQVATCTVDATNITLTWTKTGTIAANTMNIFWEATG